VLEGHFRVVSFEKQDVQSVLAVELSLMKGPAAIQVLHDRQRIEVAIVTPYVSDTLVIGSGKHRGMLQRRKIASRSGLAGRLFPQGRRSSLKRRNGRIGVREILRRGDLGSASG
jgi:hypothetical protein